MYSDDSLRVRRNLQTYRAHNYIKLTDETVNELAVTNTLDEKNITGKSYGIIDTKNQNATIDRLVFLNRRNTEDFTYNHIDNKIIKKALISKNIIGIRFMDIHLLKKANILMERLEKVDCYKLEVPNNIKFLKANKSKLFKLFSC